MKTYEERLYESADLVIKLVWIYTVFRALWERKQSHVRARQGHPELFLALHESLLCTFCMATWVLFNEKAKTESLPNLIQQVELSNPGLGKNLKAEIYHRKNSLAKIASLRNQAFAHRYTTTNQRQVWDKIRPLLKNMKEVANLTKSLFIQLAKESGSKRLQDFEKQQPSEARLHLIVGDARRVVESFPE